MTEGLLIANPELVCIRGTHAVVRRDYEDVKKGKVALISGGGSGHEPMHAGFVGRGMLTACVAGGVFASPGVDSILAVSPPYTQPKEEHSPSLTTQRRASDGRAPFRLLFVGHPNSHRTCRMPPYCQSRTHHPYDTSTHPDSHSLFLVLASANVPRSYSPPLFA